MFVGQSERSRSSSYIAATPNKSVGKRFSLTSAYSATRRWTSAQNPAHRRDAEYAENAQSLFPTNPNGFQPQFATGP